MITIKKPRELENNDINKNNNNFSKLEIKEEHINNFTKYNEISEKNGNNNISNSNIKNDGDVNYKRGFS